MAKQTRRSESAYLVCLEGKGRGRHLGSCGKGMVMLTTPLCGLLHSVLLSKLYGVFSALSETKTSQ